MDRDVVTAAGRDAGGERDGHRDYAAHGAVRLDGLLPRPLTDFFSDYAKLLSHNDVMRRSQQQVVGSSETYGDPAFDALLGGLTPNVSDAIGIPLVPTYSFMRIYRRGQPLSPHADRPSCEHSVTVHLAASSPEPWAVSYIDLLGVEHAVDLEVGDAVAYQGCALTHWRTPCPVEWYMQLFLHYVDPTGPNGAWRYDRRRFLGLPAAT